MDAIYAGRVVLPRSTLFVLACVGVVLLCCGFAEGVAGVSEGDPGFRALWVGGFIVGGVVLLGASAVSVRNLVRRYDVVLSTASLLVAAVPSVAVVALVLSAAQPR